MKAILPRLLVLLSLLSSSSGSPAAEEEWIEVKTESFFALSNANARKSNVFLEKLERYDSLIRALSGLRAESEIPLVLVLFKNEKSLAAYRFIRNGQPVDGPGYYRRGRERDMMAVNIEAGDDESRVILHEYVHRLAAHQQNPWPNWLIEGLAEFYSTFHLSGQRATIGTTADYHVYFLRGQRLLPMSNLTAVDHRSPEYNENEKRGIFYAQSWALAHFLMMAENHRYRPQLAHYIRLLEETGDWRRSFDEAFEYSSQALEEKLRSYVRQDQYSNEAIRLENESALPDPAVRKLRPDEWKIHLGDLLAQIGRFDQAKALYQESHASGNSNGEATRRLNQLPEAMQLSRLDEEDQFLDVSPSQSQPTSSEPLPEYVVLFEQARAKFDEVGDELSFGDEGLVSEAFQDVETAIQSNLNYAPSHHLFGELALVTERRLDEAVEHVKTAIRLDPTEEQFRVTLAQIHMFSDRFAEAREAIQPVTESDNEVRSKYARQLLENIDKLESYLKTSAQSPNGSGLPADQGTACKPSFVNVDGLSYRDGVLSELQCGDNGILFLLDVGDEQLRFLDPSPDQPIVFSCSVPLNELQCGSFQKPARIYYDSREDPVNGTIRALAVEIRR